MGEGGVDTLEIVFIIKNTFLKVKRRSGKEERENNENWEREKSWERHIQERVNYWGTSYKGLPSRPKQSLCASLLTRLTSPFPPQPSLLPPLLRSYSILTLSERVCREVYILSLLVVNIILLSARMLLIMLTLKQGVTKMSCHTETIVSWDKIGFLLRRRHWV